MSSRGFVLPAVWQDLIPESGGRLEHFYNLGAMEHFVRRIDATALVDARDDLIFTEEMDVNDVYYSFLTKNGAEDERFTIILLFHGQLVMDAAKSTFCWVGNRPYRNPKFNTRL